MALNANKIVEETPKPRKTGKIFSYGIQELMINDITFKEAATGSLQMEVHMETAPVVEEGFEGIDKAKGQVGTVRGSWVKQGDDGAEAAEKEFAKLIEVCKACGLTANDYSGDFATIGDFTKHIVPKLKGKYARYKIVAELYPKFKDDGTPGYPGAELKFPYFKNQMVEAMSVKPTKLKFDENSEYDVNRKKLNATADTQQPVDSKLPF